MDYYLLANQLVENLDTVLGLLSFHGLCWTFQSERYWVVDILCFFAVYISFMLPFGDIVSKVDREYLDVQGDGGYQFKHNSNRQASGSA
jgi:hypothetical protein